MPELNTRNWKLKTRTVLILLFLIGTFSPAFSQDKSLKMEAAEISEEAKEISTRSKKIDKQIDLIKLRVNEIFNNSSTVHYIADKASIDNDDKVDLKKLKKDINDYKRKIGEIERQYDDPTTDPKYKTRYVLVNIGAVTLNPYTIKKNAAGKFELSETGDTDTHFFTEVYFKHRASWLERNCDNKKWHECADGDFKIGFTSTGKDSSGAVVSGAGDAYMELSLGFVQKHDFPTEEGKQISESAIISYNFPEFFGGLVTDKGSQAMHYYYSIGPAIVASAPFTGDRRIEAMTGLYYGRTQSPKFADTTAREVVVKNDYPFFEDYNTWIWRADVHLPIGESGFLTVNGRFYYINNRDDKAGTINPWTVSIGYTVPTEHIFDSIAKIIKQ